MKDALINLGWASLFTVVSAAIGLLLVLCASMAIPRVLDWLAPAIDEEKEIVRGNRAVAEYFGRLVAAAVIGVSIIIAAAIIGGVLFVTS